MASPDFPSRSFDRTLDAFVYNDAGRKAAGFKGEADDCVTRAIAIAAQLRYREIYDALNRIAKLEKFARGRIGFMAATGRGSSARTGVLKPTYKQFLTARGWTWTPTMFVGQGCKVHLRGEELPQGRLIVSCSRHLVAVIDGIVHDTHDSTRDGTRCVYGYWSRS